MRRRWRLWWRHKSWCERFAPDDDCEIPLWCRRGPFVADLVSAFIGWRGSGVIVRFGVGLPGIVGFVLPKSDVKNLVVTVHWLRFSCQTGIKWEMLCTLVRPRSIDDVMDPSAGVKTHLIVRA